MKDTAIFEVHLFVLTLKLREMFRDNEKVEAFLVDCLLHSLNDPLFIKKWMKERFLKLQMSKDTQIVLLRKAGYSYEVIRRITDKSPNTIKQIVDSYQITYNIPAEIERELQIMLQRYREVERQVESLGLKLI